MNFAPQYLKSGLALCGKAFPLFVQTFNWLVDATSSLKGDADCGAGGGGRITVDKTDFAHPVIRCTGCNGGEGGGGTVAAKTPMPFELGDISSHTEGETTVTTRPITHRIWQEGSITRHAKDTEIEWSPGGKTPSESDPLYLVLVKQFGEEGDVFEFLLQSELESQQVMNPANYYVPLYELDADLNVVCDLRPMPRLQVYDVQY